jgi:hypothetical protein
VICSYKGILFGHKKEGSTDTHCNLDETWKNTEWKEPDTKVTYYAVPFIWIQNRSRCRGGEDREWQLMDKAYFVRWGKCSGMGPWDCLCNLVNKEQWNIDYYTPLFVYVHLSFICYI